MPKFGEYETVEQLSSTEDPGYIATVWTARRSESRDRRLYVVKCYASLHRPAAQCPPDDSLPPDPALTFLEGIKALKEAGSKGGRCLIPIYAFGLAAEGAWYATDLYERKTLKEYIARRGRVDGAALRQIVHSVVTGCLALKAVRPSGAGHGNLKPSNVLLAGRPRLLRYTPFHLADPYPAPRQLRVLEPRRSGAITASLSPPAEEQELRALGELVLQLVECRVFRSAFDYNYPVARSDRWDKLGKAGEFWREKCNRLLDPKLSRDKENLASLEREFRPNPAGAWLMHGLAALAAFCWATLNKARKLCLSAWSRLTRSEPVPQKQSAVGTRGDSPLGAVPAKRRQPLAAIRAASGEFLTRMVAAGQSAWNRLRLSRAPAPNVAASPETVARRRALLNQLQLLSAALGLAMLLGGALFYGVRSARKAANHPQPGPERPVALLEPRVTNVPSVGQVPTNPPVVPVMPPLTNPPPKAPEVIPDKAASRPTNPPPVVPTSISPPAKPPRVETTPPPPPPDPAGPAFTKVMAAVSDSLERKRFEMARALCEKARKLKPGEPSVADVEQRIQQGEEKEYQEAMENARRELQTGVRDAGLAASEQALDAKPWDTSAIRLWQDCQSLAAPGKEHYHAEIQLAQKALQEGNYPEAAKHAKEAEKAEQFDETALQLLNQARKETFFASRIKALRNAKEPAATTGRQQAQRELDGAPFQFATNLARIQFAQGQLQAAWVNWAKAWGLKPADTGLAALQTQILQALKQKYEEAITGARREWAAGHRDEAMKQVNMALDLKSGDKHAIELKELIKELP